MIATGRVVLKDSPGRYIPTENYSLTHAELRAEEMILSWFDAPDHVGICFSDWVMSRSIQHTGRNSSEDRYIRWAEVGKAVDRLRPAKQRFLFDHYREHLPWLQICRKCRISPVFWFEYKRGILMLLARWLRI